MTYSQIQALLDYKITLARDDFYVYRKLINKNLKTNWFVKDVSYKLNKFYIDFKNNKKPKLILCTPPQHGKSIFIIDFISWVSGKDPNLKTIFSSFSERLGVRANLKLQKIYTSPIYNKIFPNTKINDKNSTTGVRSLRNKEMLEYVNSDGYFRNTTVQGSITGESLDLAIVDDPIKGRSEANSPTYRNKTWDWFTNDLLTRFSEEAGFLMILTRWHIDDPAGRMINKIPNIELLKYPAIATQKEKHRDVGEPLFPEHKSLEFIIERKSTMGSDFEALYQQEPIIKGGNFFKKEWIKWVSSEAISSIKFEQKFITVDTALKDKQQNDYTVYSAFGVYQDKLYWIDMFRGKPRSIERELTAKEFYQKHSEYPFRGMYIEQKASGIDLYQRLKDNGLMVYEVERDKDKIYRAETVSPYIETHSIYVSKDIPHQIDLISEYESFPNSTNDDIIDTLLDGVELCYKNNIDNEYSFLDD